MRDLKELFVACLCSDRTDLRQEHRDAGLALLTEFPPFEVERVYEIIKGTKIGETFRPGIATTVPRSFRTQVSAYLKLREMNEDFFDSSVISSKSSIRKLYAAMRIKPGKRAQSILFEDKPPEGSRLAILKNIAKQPDPTIQAQMIVENKIPYRIAASLISSMTPTVLVALINAMSSQELINNMASLQRRGVMENPDLKAMIDKKLEKAKTDRNVAGLKTRVAAEAAEGLDAETMKKLMDVGDAQVKKLGKILKTTALLVDKSGSMEQTLETGKRLAAVLSPICVNGLHVFAFDTMAYPITAGGTELSDWETAFKGIFAGGGTSGGSPVEYLRKKGVMVEQFVVVTDQEDTTPPFFSSALQDYVKAMNIRPNVVFLNVANPNGARANCRLMEKGCSQFGVEAETITFNGDYYSLPSLIPMLSKGSRLDLLMEIMDAPLPSRSHKS